MNQENLFKKLKENNIQTGDEIIALTKSGNKINGKLQLHPLAGFCIYNANNFPIAIKDIFIEKK